MSGGQALKMRIELAELMRRHHAIPQPFEPAELLPPVDHDVIVEGYAAPATIDRERCKFASDCWTTPVASDVPLLFRHDRPAGTILELRSDHRGLYVRARVSDPEARRCQYFSVCASIERYEIRSVDDPERFHFLITKASLIELSLVIAPANPAARIEHRYRQSPTVEKYDILLQWASCMQKFVQTLRVINAAAHPAQPAAPVSPAPRVSPKPAAKRQPKNEFARLVQEMNRNEHRRQAGA
jgi:phage head maturation protease